METVEFIATTPARLDTFAADASEGRFSRSFIQKLAQDGMVSVNGTPARPSHKLRAGDAITITLPAPQPSALEPENISISIIHEDEDLAVINKPAGLTVHAGSGVTSGTLVNALLYHLDGLSSAGGEERPGIVHRLDKDTAGLMVIAKNDAAHRNLSAQFAGRTVEKNYLAIVRGNPRSDSGSFTGAIGRHPVHRKKMTVTESGRNALTDYTVLKRYTDGNNAFALLRLVIHTGRTHQIRVHCSHAGMPVVGDPIYSKSGSRHPLMLASVLLAFSHPTTGQRMSFTLPLPHHMAAFLAALTEH